MFLNKEILAERLKELDNVIINIKKDKINLFSFTTVDRLFDCFINNNYCFTSQGLYNTDEIDLNIIKETATFIITTPEGKISFKSNNQIEIFENKESFITFINTNNLISTLENELTISKDISTMNHISSIKEDSSIYEMNSAASNIILEDVFDEPNNINEILEDIHSQSDFDEILAIDFETANEFHDKACSVGIALYKNGEISLCKEFLINPETYFNPNNISIHEITPDMVKNSANFAYIWGELSEFITDKTLVIAHNAQFDMTLLKKLIAIYNVTYKEFDYLCTQKLYRNNIPLSSYNLKSVALYLSEEFKHHKALDDSLICLKAFLKILKNKSYFNKDYIENQLKTPITRFKLTEENQQYKAKTKKQTFNSFSHNFKAKDLKPKTTDFDESNIIYGKTFTFTGELPSFESKKVAAQMIVDLGGTYKDGVVKANDYLVVGIDPNTSLPMSGSKVQKVLDYNNKGCDIKMISEYELMTLLEMDNITLKNSTSDLVIESLTSKEETNKIPVKVVESCNLEDITNKEFKALDSSTNNVKTKPHEESLVTIFDKSQIIKKKSQIKTKDLNTQISMFDLAFSETAIADIESKEDIIETSKEDTKNIVEFKAFSMIKPKDNFIKFESEFEKLEKLKEYKLISAKATNIDKPIYYKGIYTTKAVPCNIIGYVDLDVLIIQIDEQLHSIRGEYLKQMQDLNFSVFEAL
ncbi:MAG: exonuclease domain-containing protein [Sarcina sp.]